tara:strand:+ start:146 stop:550 length:405 start_codon:yes stop_codon:yes gene_type:complete
MIILLYSALFSYMLFFSLCIAPLITTILDKKNSSKLLRKIFPRNFYFGLFISLFLFIVSIYLKNMTSTIISCIILLFFIINLFVLIPKINLEADRNFKEKNYTKKFKILHMYSVLLFLTQMILSLSMLVKEITF